MTATISGMEAGFDFSLRHPSVVDVLNHEIRTPLTILVGHLEMLQELDLDDQVTHSIAAISAAAARLARVADGLSQFADSGGAKADLLRASGHLRWS